MTTPTPREALAEPTKLLDQLLEFDEWLNEPPSREVSEHTVARAYRFDAYRRWEKLCVPLAAILRSLAEVQPIPEQDAKDALRYRWLRDNREAQRQDGTLVDVFDEDGSLLYGEALDTAIEAAVLAEKKTEQPQDHLAMSTAGDVRGETGRGIALNYHQAQAVAERAARVRAIALRHRSVAYTELTRVVVSVGNPYYTEPNPELHGIYLQVHGKPGAPVPLFAKDLGYERDFAVERLGMRDEDGHFNHPDMDGIGWDEFDMGPQLRAIGWLSKTVSFEDDASSEMQDRYSDSSSPDCSYWTPTRPDGDWLMASIYDTEDGPVALFVHRADDPGVPTA